MKKLEWLDSKMVSLVIALSIGLSILVHPAFLLIGFIITIAVMVEAVIEALGESARRSKMTHRHP